MRSKDPRIDARRTPAALLAASLMVLVAVPALASSHREAPAITRTPQVDATDFYMFRSYEPGREDFMTIVANYNPLQDPYGGPNYFPLDPNAVYDINIDNNGNCVRDMTFRFQFGQTSPFLALQVGDEGATQSVAVPLSNITPIGGGGVNVKRTFMLNIQRLGGPNAGTRGILNPVDGSLTFEMPFDNIGEKSIPDYEAYASNFIYDIDIPNCGQGRVFVGQRKESFAVNLGEVFDLVNTNPVGPMDGEASDTDDKNITTIALEIPISCVTADSDVVAGWTTASLPLSQVRIPRPTYNAESTYSGQFRQVSRLANPLVNEVVIGLPDKDLFNSSQPRRDGQFLPYVTHPTLPELLEVIFGVTAPNLFPRADLVQIFLTGVAGLNQDGGACELMRLNTGIPATPADMQSNLGVLGGDFAGFPNGRRPGDDAVDITLRAAMGVLLSPDVAPSGGLPFTDGTVQSVTQFDAAFPYLTTPIPGSPNAPASK